MADAAVVGVPDARWGQAPVAIIQRRSGGRVDEAELLAHCGDRLAPYKRPKAIRWADGLPRNAAGKLLRRQVREAMASPKADE